MRIHYLTHVPFEGLGSMQSYFMSRGHTLTHTPMYDMQSLPAVDDVDWLVVMGGPMSVNDTDEFPWLASEKAFIQTAIASGKRVLGICLGAQLIAEVLGAPVFMGTHREIGWHPVAPQVEPPSPWANVFSDKMDVFHWHGETFDLPDGTDRLASSVATTNQGFAIGTRVVALQFHLETTPESAKALIANCANDLDDSLFVQSPEQILSDSSRFTSINTTMTALLQVMENDHVG